ncbi:4'-phosphopantetheinyl transferase superfamily protein [Listeria monocytogenes]|nr:4'-phosphopantetheinyl transferase superfamily protein [Listeria monocytogenes]
MIQIFYVSIEESCELNKLMNSLSLSYVKKINLFKNEISKRQKVVSNVLLLYVLFSNLNSWEFEIEISNFGKKYINNPNIYFSISHSGEYVICAISKSNIGIDIEKSITDTSNLSDQIMSEKEIKLYGYEINLTKFWTMKESYLKFLGVGLNKEPKSLTFIGQKNEYTITEENEKTYCRTFSFSDEYYVSYATSREQTQSTLNMVNMSEIINFVNDNLIHVNNRIKY